MDDIDVGKRKKLQAGLALLAIGAVIVTTAVASSPKTMVAMQNTASTSTTQTATTSPSPATGATSAPSSSLYKDGSYSATGSYFSPAGQESVTVNVTLKSDVITASSVESGANDPTATTYQDSFIGGYKKFVVGKPINSVKLSNVSGSSLTSQGFNDAIKQIEKQAKA